MDPAVESKPTLDDVAAAMAATHGRTPTAVIDAFLSPPKTIIGQRLAPYTAGHDLIFSCIGHPWARGGEWDGRDVLIALFVCSHSSRDLFAMISDERFEPLFFEFVEQIPGADLEVVNAELLGHLARSRKTALALENPQSTAKKKAEVLGGCLTRFARRARFLVGGLTACCMTSRSRSFSP